jgi:hypothetical protein
MNYTLEIYHYPPNFLYTMLCARAFSFSVRAVGQTHSLASFGLSVGSWGLANAKHSRAPLKIKIS